MRTITSTSNPEPAATLPAPLTQNVLVTLDSKGRVRASREQRRVILAEFERSGVSAAQFAKRTGLKYSTLAGWLQRYRRTKPQARVRPVRWLEAAVAPAPNFGGQPPLAVVLVLPGGAHVEITDVNQAVLAAALVRALEKPAGPC